MWDKFKETLNQATQKVGPVLGQAKDAAGSLASQTSQTAEPIISEVKNFVKDGGYTPTTHVANGCDQKVYAKVDTVEDDLLSRLNFGSIKVLDYFNVKSPSIKASNPKPEPGYTAISPGVATPFNPKVGIGNSNWFHRSTVYTTVYMIKDGKMEILCENYPRPSDRNVIIAPDYTCRAAKVGQIWEDNYGNSFKAKSKI